MESYLFQVYSNEIFALVMIHNRSTWSLAENENALFLSEIVSKSTSLALTNLSKVMLLITLSYHSEFQDNNIIIASRMSGRICLCNVLFVINLVLKLI